VAADAKASAADGGTTATAAVLTDQPTPADGSGVYTLGEAKGLVSAGRFEQAETAYRALLDKDPNNADAWEGLGDSYAGRKMKLEAKESYEKALSLDKTKMNLKDWIDKNVRH
jgi:Flp pilus assembly protein TadD